MKVFISWSGELSHKIAKVFRDWLPSVIQIIEPYVSSEDIDKGARWSTDISKELDESSYGILCVTKQNIEATWLNFEAGALSKAFDKSRVSPFLFGVKRSEIKGPILQFQSTIHDKEDVRKLLQSLNKACDPSCLEDGRLDSIFEVWWPRLKEELDKIIPEAEAGITDEKNRVDAEKRVDIDILEELLELVRNQQKRLSDPEQLLPPEYLTYILRRHYRPIEQEVYHDLRKSWHEFRSHIDTLADEENIPVSQIKHIVQDLSRPLDYLFEHLQITSKSKRLIDRLKYDF